MHTQLIHAAVLAAITGGLLAQDPPRRADQGRRDDAVAAEAGRTGMPMRYRASKLIGCDVKNAKGENLGDIEEIVVDNKRVSYAVLSFGGVLGIGEKYFAIPWRMLRLTPRDKDNVDATLDLEKETLKNAPGFDKNNWPDMADQTWIGRIEGHYRTPGAPERTTEDPPAAPPRADMPGGDPARAGTHDPRSREFTARRLSKLIGVDVVNQRNQDLGEVEDVIVDAGRGTCDAALLGYGGVLGMGEKLVLVPFDVLHYDRAKETFVLPTTLADLDAVAFKGELPPLNDDAWMKRARDHFAKVDAAAGKLEAGTPVDAGDAVVIYKDTYDPKKTETIKGRVTTIGTARVADRDERLRLRVQADDGREVIVYAAPWTWSDQQSLGLRVGNTVEVTGSPAQSGRGTVLVAGTIKADGKTVKFRDDEGKPLWTRDGAVRKQ
jgi:sporulation protein YlmC with PRC-barrel domain